MFLPYFFLSIYVQAGSGWRLDFLSLLIGLILGAALALAVIRYLPNIMAGRDRLVTQARRTQAWVRSGVEVRYQVETAEYIERYHLGGNKAALEQIFVPPLIVGQISKADPDTPFQPSPDWLRFIWPSLVDRVALDPPPVVSLRQLLMQGRRVVVSAESGAGKTTLLAYCALACANATEMGPFTPLLAVAPVFVHLAELAYRPPVSETETAAPDPGPIANLVTALQRRSGALTASGLSDLFHQKAAAGNLLLLLDGWDDLAPEERPEVTDWLRRLLAVYPDVRIFMTGPERGYGPLAELGFVVVGLLPWRLGEAEEFESRWRTVFEERVRLPLSIFWQPGQMPLESTLRLWHAFEERHADRDQMPKRWVELMEMRLRNLLPKFDGETDPPWLAPVTREFWQHLAYLMVSERRLYFEKAEVEEIVETILVDNGAKEDRGSGQRLFGTLKNSHLFVFWPNDRIGFYSSLWRDFLAATHAAAFHLKDEILEHLTDPFWAGVVRFYVGRVGAAEIATLMLESGRRDPLSENLFRVAAWLPEAPDPGEWRRQVLIQLGQLVVKANLPIAMRQRAAIALALTNEVGVLSFLRQLLRQEEPGLRQVALASIARLGAEIGLELAEKMFSDSTPQVRASAVYILTWLNDPVVENPILTALVERDEHKSQAAAVGLALNGNTTAFEILREAAHDEALHVRRAAVHGLEMVNAYWVVELLETLEREDEQWMVKAAAGSALETIVARNRERPWRPVGPGDKGWLIEWAARQERAVPAGASAMPVLLEALSEAVDPVIRVAAALALGQIGRQNTIPELQKTLRDPEPIVREAAFIGLCMIGRAWDVGVIGMRNP